MRLPLLALAGLAACATPEPSHEVRGVYQGPSSTQGAVTIAHEAIPGVMEAMTMDFAFTDTAGLGALSPGDKVRFRLTMPAGGVFRVDGLTRLPDTTRLVLAPTMQEAPGDTVSADTATPDTVASAPTAADSADGAR